MLSLSTHHHHLSAYNLRHVAMQSATQPCPYAEVIIRNKGSSVRTFKNLLITNLLLLNSTISSSLKKHR